jgi:Spy/CpxP family protein refolding chaperone
MTRYRSLTVLAIALVLGAGLLAAAQTQAAEGSRRGFRGSRSRSSLFGLLRLEQVQKEMKLNEEQTEKVARLVEKLGAEMREQYGALREIEGRDQQRAKAAELSDQFDEKVREGLGDVVEREQMIRLYQIRLQVRAVVDSLANRYVAGRLKLTDEQKEKLAQIAKDTRAKQSELYGAMREASDDKRGEVFQKLRKLRSDASKQALDLLTAEQKTAFEEMKGEKVELDMGRRSR